MFKKIAFVSLFSILSIVVFGQEKITLKKERMSDLQPQSTFKAKQPVGYLFKVGDGEYQAVGFRGENLMEVLKNDPEAYKEFKRFKRKAKLSKVFSWIGVGSALAYLVILDDNDTESQTIRKLVATGIVSLTGSISSLVLFKKAPRHLENAIVIYNRNLE